MDELIVGTYEGFMLGYSLSSQDEVTKLKQTFATQSHTSSVRCVSTGGKFLASGGTDDKVVVIDMKSRKEHTVLMNHDGTINAVAFTNGGTHLITGSDDGKLIVTRVGNWQVEKIWKKAHGGQPITDIAVHPSDKMALSVGGDKTLRTWNLVKGRPAFTINLASKGVTMPTEIKFSPGGDRFSLVSLQNVDVWTISKAGIEKRITCTSKPSCVQWITDERLFVGLENGNILSLTVSDTQAQTFSAHKQRVKSLHYENEVLYSASSSGEMKVWTVTESNNLAEICSANAGCRITCVTLNRQSKFIKKEEDTVEEAKSDSEEETVPDDAGDNSEASEEAEEVSPPAKRKPGAFVTISYGDDEKEGTEPSPKKIKRKKRNRKPKNKKSQ